MFLARSKARARLAVLLVLINIDVDASSTKNVVRVNAHANDALEQERLFARLAVVRAGCEVLLRGGKRVADRGRRSQITALLADLRALHEAEEEIDAVAVNAFEKAYALVSRASRTLTAPVRRHT